MADFDYSTTIKSYNKWDHTKYIPDIVVINLGANDGSSYSLCKNDSEKKAFLKEFENKYKTFIDKINSTYKNVKIISYTNMIEFDKDIKSSIKKIIAEYDNITELDSNCLSVGGIMPGRGHPNKEMQKYAGHELAVLIKKLLN